MNSSNQQSPKKNYNSPNLIAYGNIRELTQATSSGAFFDAVPVTPSPNRSGKG